MQQPQQEQQQLQPQVIVIQQPIVIDPRANRAPAPFIRRGVKFNNGCRCPGSLFITLGVVGGSITYVGIILASVIRDQPMYGILLLFLGVPMVVACGRLCCIARRDFNALPQDHPDRAKYSTNPFLPQQAAAAAFQLPAGAQVVRYPPAASPSGGIVVGYPPAASSPPGADLPPSYEDVAKNSAYV